MAEILSKIVKTSMVIIYVVGILTLSTAAHELSHVYDLKDKVMIQDVCLMNIPYDTFPEGAYGYVRNLEYGIEPTTSETRATIIGVIVGFLLTMCLGYSLNKQKVQKQ